MSQYAERKECIGNIDAKQMIISQIHFHHWKSQLATDEYNKATLNHDYKTLHESNSIQLAHDASISSLKFALRCIVAQEAEASGRQVSADLSQLDSFIEELING